MKVLYTFMLSLTIMLLAGSCQKHFTEVNASSALAEEARQDFNQLSQPKPKALDAILQAAGNPRLQTGRMPEWNKSQEKTITSGRVVVTPIAYDHLIAVHTSDSSRVLYSLADITFLYSYKEKTGGFRHELVTYLPDAYYQGPGHPFSGFINVDDWLGNKIKRLRVDKSGKWYSTANTSHNSQRTIEICYYTTYTIGYANDPSSNYTWTECNGCSYYDFQDQLMSGDDGSGGGGGGGGGGSTTDYTGGNGPELPSLPTPTVVSPKTPITSIPDYLKCYSATLPASHSYAVTICVQQPNPGTRDPWTFTTNLNPYPVAIGHTFLILSEQDGASIVSRNIGFYPASFVYPGSGDVVGQFGNDENHSFNVSLTIPVTSDQFYLLLNAVYHASASHMMYNLNSNNCTTFALDVLSAAGINLPRTTGNWLGGNGVDPGDLGEDIRSLKPQLGWAVGTENRRHDNTGVCN